MKKKNMIIVMVISLVIVVYGFIVVNAGMPKFIKDRSSFKINYNFLPFDFRVEMGDYSLYINKKVGLNIKNSSAKLLNNIEKSMNQNVSNFVDKTSTVFKNAEDKITEVIQNRGK
ncbi:hypothetical protein P8V03_01485 [Clostridium sp. A1-XYC3]|uniref:Uncharacterized protein n=1 Tax=Clostridium tanneri TaxID=3037988 RepID=A0ABU4JNV2_9CLOT|nr:hypothetical protein [Clostridium sp. A1-XYC3]MDW8799824.1 hypothetical protein [Clostridium sp. A1-XYC3]